MHSLNCKITPQQSALPNILFFVDSARLNEVCLVLSCWSSCIFTTPTFASVSTSLPQLWVTHFIHILLCLYLRSCSGSVSPPSFISGAASLLVVVELLRAKDLVLDIMTNFVAILCYILQILLLTSFSKSSASVLASSHCQLLP